MSFRLIASASGQPRVLLEGEPSYCKALEAAPSVREPVLNRGRWLVVTFAAWSMPDVRQAEMALEVVKRLGGPLQLGIRPFNDADDLHAWLPEVSSTGLTPIWVLLTEGQVTGAHHGLLQPAELIAFIERSVSERRAT